MLYIVGIGSGGISAMTEEAVLALEDSVLIVGYDLYIDMIKKHIKNKEFYSTPMKGERERCLYAIERAEKGENVSVISSGDSGIYGMASLIYELCADKDIEIRVVAGITAAVSGAALLGAPIGHDFAIISLSDLLTPFELIEKRLYHAAKADMAIVLYNPSSKKRREHLKKACRIIRQARDINVVCGYAENIGREGERAVVTDLDTLENTQVNMFTTVFIGNSTTRNIKGKMVTPRGYGNEQNNDICRDHRGQSAL